MRTGFELCRIHDMIQRRHQARQGKVQSVVRLDQVIAIIDCATNITELPSTLPKPST